MFSFFLNIFCTTVSPIFRICFDYLTAFGMDGMGWESRTVLRAVTLILY